MSVKWGDLCGNKVFLRSFLGGKAPESLDRVHLFELFFSEAKHPIQSLKTDHYVLVISPPQMLEKFGGIGGAALEVRRRSLDSSFLTRQFSIRACASAERILICAWTQTHCRRLKELLSCSSIHNFPSLETFTSPLLPSNLIPFLICFSLFPTSLSLSPVLSCHSLVARRASSRIHGVARDVGPW